jgi:hypothetical protein
MMRRDLVRRRVRLIGSRMHGGTGEPVHGVEEIVLGFVGDAMCLGERGVRVDGDLHLGVQLVPDPPDPHRLHSAHTVGIPEVTLDLVDQRGIHGVHEASEHLTRG